jgi:hypothetical protein
LKAAIDVCTLAMTTLFNFVLLGAPLLFVAVLVMRRRSADDSKFSGVQRVIAGLGVISAVASGVRLLTSPSYSDGQTLLEVNGPWVFVVLLIPIALTLPSVIAGSSTRTLYTASCALALSIFCFISGFSIGFFYVPAAALLVVAGAVGLVSPRTA